jgi:hypothetical protein
MVFFLSKAHTSHITVIRSKFCLIVRGGIDHSESAVHSPSALNTHAKVLVSCDVCFVSLPLNAQAPQITIVILDTCICRFSISTMCANNRLRFDRVAVQRANRLVEFRAAAARGGASVARADAEQCFGAGRSEGVCSCFACVAGGGQIY